MTRINYVCRLVAKSALGKQALTRLRTCFSHEMLDRVTIIQDEAY